MAELNSELGRDRRPDRDDFDNSLLFFFLLLVIIFCNCDSGRRY
ncbi:hypothetical protein [Anaerosalibacter bizertensis]|nr:hypothetical protein [Anaerosalibacter bizertensis]